MALLVILRMEEKVCGEMEMPQDARIGGRVCSRIDAYKGIPSLSHTTLYLGVLSLGAM